MTLTVTDNNGNTSTCTSTVTVDDTVAPVANCQDLTIELDASGNASITADDIDNGSYDMWYRFFSFRSKLHLIVQTLEATL